MKTTIELPDSLLESAKRAAREDRTTLRALVEAGLREVLARRERGSSFRLRDESVDGEGLDPAFRAAGWPIIRDAIHGPREE
jgi:Arc/MetJ family transcription regulator